MDIIQTNNTDNFIDDNNHLLNHSSFVYYTTPTRLTANMSHAASLESNIISQTLLPTKATLITVIPPPHSTTTLTSLTAIIANASDNIHSVEVEQTSEQRSAEEWAHFYDLALSWQGICLITLFCVLIVITVFGNTLVIMAIITTRRLRTVTNCFVMSLAVADLLVGIFVMPPAVAVHLIGSWRLGWILCDIWISLDVLLCTASILSLCAISVDRYLAVTKPLKYSRRRRSKRLALLMILIVWLVALAITCPPMLGWYEPGRRDLDECRYNQNKGYVIYSAMGSFFLPMVVMIYVYARISCVIASRHDKMTTINVHNKRFRRYTSTDPDLDIETELFDQGDERRFSNQTIVNELHEVMLPDLENGHALLSLPASNGKGNCYELTRPVTWRLSVSHHLPGHPRRQQFTQSCPPGSIATQTWHPRNSHQHNQQQFKSLASCIISLKKEHKTTQTLSIVVGGFIACWLPFFIYYLLTPFLPPHQQSRVLTNVLTWLGWFNSAINPFIYAFYSIDFRVAFWRLICRRVCSSARRPQTPTNTMSMRL